MGGHRRGRDAARRGVRHDGRAYPRTGGPYAYARRAFGDFVGFQTAWGYWIAAWVGNAAIATAFVGYTTVVWPGLADSSLAMALLAVGAIWLLTFVNALGVRQGGRVQVVTTILKFVPLALIGVIGLFSMDTAHFTPFLEASGSAGRHALTMLEGITAAIGLTLWAFIGLESATVPAEEVKDPSGRSPGPRTSGPHHHADLHRGDRRGDGHHPALSVPTSNAPFADAAQTIFGGAWGKWVAVVGMISAFGA